MARTKKRIRSKFAEIAFLGEEPEFDGELSRTKLGEAYNWYNYFHTIKESRKWILEWMLLNDYDPEAINIIAKTANTTLTQTQASQARMMIRGASNTDIGCQLINRLNIIIAAEPIIKSVKKEEIINDIDNQLIADLDDVLDVFFMTNKVQNVHKIVLNRKSREMVEALDYFSELLNFAYGENPLPKSIEQLILIIDAIDTEKINVKRRKPRKPRTKKVRTSAKIVEKIKYLNESNEYKAVSINPTKILKSTTLLTFNVKYRILTKYVALKGEMFEVKGTTILNYDPSKSFAMRIRKPAKVLPSVMSNAKRVIDKMLGGLTTKKLEVGDRINKNTLLLRSF